MATLQELKRKQAESWSKYHRAKAEGATGRRLGAFKGGTTRRGRAIIAKLEELRTRARTARTPEPATVKSQEVETVKECNSSRIGAIVATLKGGAVALVQRVKQGRHKEQAQAPAPIEAIEKLQKGAEEARACRSYQLAQEIEEAGDRLREMEGMETMAELYRAEELEDLDRWRDWYE